ncbi:probable transmembrane GTPase FZO-like, chloroplastic isoform X1 [Zingiber officinale]|uniref:probable transmembrane GTPase FZO-like, chloroplastic isoform X1 n=1 Tax=Zingiber officinale TaxID=94328 RepID=UPI001C4B9B40|nr:probable transmembrane GTPase FZO-like, chloroplastic isoform X1 [Zingiber officinale]
MVACLLHGHSPFAAARSPRLPLFPKPLSAFPFCRRPSLSDRRSTPRTVNAVGPNSSSFPNPQKQMQQQQQQQQVRTLFPGGFKRPEISVPTLVLRLSVDESIERGAEIDFALPKGVGVVVLDGGDETGGRLYEAACALKSLVGDRAYLLIAERVDIAAAVGANGVVLSDSAIPTLVARNMMMKSKSDSVYLPLVARTVQSTASALSASSSEGADFLIMSMKADKFDDILGSSVIQQMKVPLFFIATDFFPDRLPSDMASNLLKAGASGMVLCLNELKSFDDGTLKMFSRPYMANGTMQDKYQNSRAKMDDARFANNRQAGIMGFSKLDDRELELIERERVLINEAVSIIQKATPMMKDVSLLVDAAARLSEPFLLVIVGEFNSGKSTVINALLGRRYLKEGVVPTTNEITLLLHSETESANHSHCERNPDGQFICYLSSPILKQMNLVDTPGTNVILQRQQRLTEEFVPRADLILFVISADRPLTESEVAFLLYVQQWKKKVVFVLNKLDLYRTSSELEEATSFVKENARRLLNSEDIRLFPVSARSALDAKLSSSSYKAVKYEEALFSDSRWMSSQFYELEKFLFSLLDGTTESGLERVKLKLETPLAIADKLLSSCQALVKQENEIASEDLISIAGILSSVKDYSAKIESESVTWRKSITSAVETAKSRALKLTDSLLRLSNIDLIPTYALKTERVGSTFATSTFQNDIINPALSDAQRVLADYSEWSESCNSREAKLYLEHFKKQWPALVDTNGEFHLEKYSINIASGDFSSKVIENFSSGAAARLFEQEIREVVVGTFGGLGAAGLSASLLTSVLPTTLEDLLALAFCSAGGWLAISNFPRRRKETMEKVSKVADKLATELNDAMLKDLMNSVEKLNQFVEAISRPYVDAAQDRIDRSIEMQEELAKAEQNLQALRVEIQNLHVS